MLFRNETDEAIDILPDAVVVGGDGDDDPAPLAWWHAILHNPGWTAIMTISLGLFLFVLWAACKGYARRRGWCIPTAPALPPTLARAPARAPTSARAPARAPTPAARPLPRGWWPVNELERRQAENARAKAERRAELEKRTPEVTFVVTEDHLDWSADIEAGRIDDYGEGGAAAIADDAGTNSQRSLVLVPPIDLQFGDGHRIRHGFHDAECAICMLDYAPGDVVTCSRECPHAFHRDCILDWLAGDCVTTKQRGCPLCRGEFLPSKEEALSKDEAPSKPMDDRATSGAPDRDLDGDNTSSGRGREREEGTEWRAQDDAL